MSEVDSMRNYLLLIAAWLVFVMILLVRRRRTGKDAGVWLLSGSVGVVLGISGGLAILPWLGFQISKVHSPGEPGFEYGGAPAFERPPLAKDKEEQLRLAVLEAMSKGQWRANVTAREGRLLRTLTEAVDAKYVVEIGTSSGYSSIWLALALRKTGGKLYTHEINPAAVKLAQANFEKAAVDDRITVIEGDAHETIAQHKQPIDVLFLDAEKSGYVDYLEKLLPLVRPGGLILAHDVSNPRVADARFIETVTRNPDLETSFLLMESFGISVSLKKR